MFHRDDKPVLILQHTALSHPATVYEALAGLGVGTDVCQLHAGARLPGDASLGDYEAMIVLGGAMNTDDADEFPFLIAERELLVAALARELPVLGICLGAQQLARACGGTVYQRETPEVGWLPLRVQAPDPLFAGVPSPFRALEWHQQSFTAPREAVVIAAREGDERSADGVQAFRIGRRAWGLQFHPEVDESMLDTWLRHDNKGLRHRDPDRLRDLHRRRREIVAASRELCRTLVGNFVNSIWA